MKEVKKFLQKLKWERLLTAIIALVLGIVFVANPSGSGRFVCRLAGILMVVAAAVFLIKYALTKFISSEHLLFGSALLLIGIYFLVKTDVVTSVIGLFFGIFLLIDGVGKIQQSCDAIRQKAKGWWILFAFAVLTILLAVLVIFADSVMLLLGISLIVDAVCDVLAITLLDADFRALKRNVRHDENDFGEMDEL